MKIGKRAEAKIKTNPDKRNGFRTLVLIGVIMITVVLITWVYTLGRKAEDTVSVAMWNEPVYKNEVITESMLVEYKMIKAEFDKYAVNSKGGSKKRRIVKWDEHSKLVGTFAAYPLKEETIVFMNDVAISRVDNSESVLYSFPGKEIVTLTIGDEQLDSFKTFLQPGDRVNITCTYKTAEDYEYVDLDGNKQKEEVENFKQERVFEDVMLADLLNNQGDSILDMYKTYNELSVYEQSLQDASESWKKQTQPSSILLALTPEEEKRYFEYLAKEDSQFIMTLPQRTK